MIEDTLRMRQRGDGIKKESKPHLCLERKIL